MIECCRIHLASGEVVLVDPEDYAWASQYRWRKCGSGYAMRSLPRAGGKAGSKLMHREIMGAQPGQQVDHINRNRLDNRRSNLRFATVSQNGYNVSPYKGQSQYKGVSMATKGRPYQAKITINGRLVWLGSYDTEEEAARAYDSAAAHFVPEFAAYNFSDRIEPYQAPCPARYRNNTSGYRGVSWNKRTNKWVAYIAIHGQVIFLGGFVDIADAVQARLNAEAQYRRDEEI